MKRGLLVCMVVLMLVMMVLYGCKGNSSAVVLPVHAPTLYVGNWGGGARLTISVFTSAVTATGDAFADRIITGSTTSVLGASGLVRDPGIDQLYVAGFNSNSIGVYALASSASGTTDHARIITSATTTMSSPYGLWLDTAADRLYVSAYSANRIFVFDNASAADGATVPSRIITSSGTSTLSGPGNMWLDKAADELYVTTQMGSPNQIMVYNNASTADGNTVPSRIITSATTTVNALGIWLDKSADRLYVSGFNTNNIVVFDSASTADGPTVPSRVIAGANTTLLQPTAIQLDPFHDMLYTANSGTSSIVVFHNASTISGDVAPSRIITRVNSKLAVPYGIWLDSP